LATILKVILTLLGGILALSLSSAFIFVLEQSDAPMALNVLFLVLRLAVTFLAARMIWRRLSYPSAAPSIWQAIALGALLVGGIAFFVGFFGPIIFAPNANQGPMLGLFITGPLGAVLGGIGGAIRHKLQQRRRAARQSTHV
jgi:hypothetical protein